MRGLIICLLSFIFAKDKIYGDITEEIEIVRVYDGDTFYINIPAWPSIVGENIAIRIYGIDTPEIRTRNRREKKLDMKPKM